MSIHYQLYIQLPGVEPTIWRRLTVPADFTFDQFHDVLQMSMGWNNEDSYEFHINGTTVRDFGPDIDMGEDPEDRDAAECVLDELLTMVNARFTYIYGDWEHKLTVEKIFDVEGESQHPACIGGEGNCPPEDCGGVAGYQQMLEVLSNMQHPKYASVARQLSTVSDFNLEDVNARLKRYSEEWEEIYDETQRTIDRLENGGDLDDEDFDDEDLGDEDLGDEDLGDEDLGDEDIDDDEYGYSEYGYLKDLKSPADVFNDEVEAEKIDDWVTEALEEEGSMEHKAFTRLVKEGHDEEKAKSMILNAFVIEWYYDLKYGMADYLDRFEYNLEHLPEEPKEIRSMEWAIHILNNCSKGIPINAIAYVHDDTSPESTAAVIKVLNEYGARQCHWEDCALTPFWYSLAAEGHLCEDLIDPVIGLYGKNHPYATDWLHDQGQFLIGKLAQKYPDLTAQKVLAAMEKDADTKSDGLVYYLLDAFDFCDVGLFKDRLIALLKRDDIYWHDLLASTLAHLQIKEALPVLKEQKRLLESGPPESSNHTDWHLVEIKEAIEQLTTGVDPHPDVMVPRCLERTTTWREEFAAAEKYFYEVGPPLMDDHDDTFERNNYFNPWPHILNRQQPIKKEIKTGRNDPCPCGSGKKYKKCCLDKDVREGRA